jgi:hypothetical protein
MLQLSQFHRCWATATAVAAASIAAAAAIFAQRADRNLRSTIQLECNSRLQANVLCIHKIMFE